MFELNRITSVSCLVVLLVGGVIPLGPARGQVEAPQKFEIPFAQINQKRITTTISFLASDEMAGRDTPSRELTIASAYVASRFRGAGLTGLGEEGSFFQSTDVSVISVPQTGVVVNRNGAAVEQFGLLSSTSTPFSFSGEVTMVGDDLPKETKFDGPVCIVADTFDSRRAQANFQAKTARLRRNGATAVLVQVDPDHPLINQAAKMSQPRLVRSRGPQSRPATDGEAGPVLLIGKTETDGQFSIELPRQVKGTSEVRNVIGVLPGSDPELADEAIIFSAHLDHIGVRKSSGDTIFNGADDDATGVTAVLTLADAFAAMPVHPKRTLIFMTFWGEEKGLLGSKYYAENPIWPLEKTIANINIEMIGRPEAGANEKCWVTGWHQSSLGKLMGEGSQEVGVLIFEHPKFSAMLYRSSDNYSLAKKGVIAHSFSAGSLHGDYHAVTDEWEKLELKHMTRVIQGLFAGSIRIANGVVTPVKAEKSR